MAEPAWKLPTPRVAEKVEETSTLQRWVELSDGVADARADAAGARADTAEAENARLRAEIERLSAANRP